MTTKSKGSGKKSRRPTVNIEGSGTRNDKGNNEGNGDGNGNGEGQEGSFAALRMTANDDEETEDQNDDCDGVCFARPGL
jgi:hypothetical protein